MTNFSILINLGLTSLGIFLKTFIVHRFWSRIPKLYFVCREGSSLSHYFYCFCSNIFPFFSIPQFGGKELRDEEQTAESIKNQMTVKEWEKVFEMSQDKNLYHNLCTSLFPTIHGKSFINFHKLEIKIIKQQHAIP